MQALDMAAMIGFAGLSVPAGAVETYHGICDASAIIRVGDHLIVASDERDTNKRNLLMTYRLGTPQGRALDLGPLLGKGEADIEGVAQLGDRLFWIGSHGTNDDGEAKPQRRVLFTTTLTRTQAGPELKLGKVWRGLLDDLARDQRYAPFDLAAAALRAPKTANGLSIEGLTAQGGRLLIGFRGPVTGGKALIATLTNPVAVLGGARGVFDAPVVLDLGAGRGIRSLDAHPDGSLTIVAGPVGSSGSFAVHDLIGGRLRPRAAALAGLRVEGIALGQGGAMIVASDDGQLGSTPCKDLPDARKRFRLLQLGANGQPSGSGAVTRTGTSPSR